MPKRSAAAERRDLDESETIERAPIGLHGTDGGEEIARPPSTAAEMLALVHADLWPSPLNPRKHFDDAKIEELAASIATEGVLQNLIARPSADGRYEIVAGESRWRAVKLLIETSRVAADIPLRVLVKPMSDEQVLALALTENVQRKDLTPMEEAHAIQQLRQGGRSTAEIAEMTGMTQRNVQLRLALVEKLLPEVQTAVADGRIDIEKARVLAQAAPAKQKVLFAETQGAYPKLRTADDLREAVRSGQVPERNAAFDLALYTGDWIEVAPRDLEAEYNARPEDEREGYTLKEFIADERDEDHMVDGGRCFADIPQFFKLQRAVAKQNAADLKAAGAAWVEIKNSFSSWQYDKASAKTGGVIIHLDGKTGAIEVHKGLKKKDHNGGGTAGDQDDAPAKPRKADPKESFTREHLAQAAARRAGALQRAIAEDADAAMRIAVLSILTGGRCGMEWSRDGDGPAIAAEIRADLNAMLKKHLGGFKAIEQSEGEFTTIWPNPQQIPGVVAAVWKMPAAALSKLFAHLVAVNVGAGDEWNISPAIDVVAIADQLGIAGNEAKHGLALAHDDLIGLETPALAGIAREIGLEHDVKLEDDDAGDQLADGIDLMIKDGAAKGFVMPTLLFTGDCTAQIKALVEGKAAPKPKPKAKKPAAKKPAAKKPAKKTKKAKG